MRMGPMKEVYDGIIFKIKQREITFPDGSKKIFEYCARPGSVTILAFDDKNNLLLIKERRLEYKGATWFLPAGRIDKGETPLRAAQRELREETGFGAETIKKIYQKSTGSTLLWDVHIYAARDLYPAPLDGDEHFPIQIAPTPFKRAVEMAMDGTIENEFIAFHIIKFDYMLKRGQFKW